MAEYAKSAPVPRVWAYKLALSTAQEEAFARILETQRRLYNRALLYRELLWETHRATISAGDLKKRLITQARQGNAAPDFDAYAVWQSWRRYRILEWMIENGDPAPSREEVDAARPDYLPSIEEIDTAMAALASESAPYIRQCPRRVNSATIDRLDVAYKVYFSLLKKFSRGEMEHLPGRPSLRGRRHFETFGYDAWASGRHEHGALRPEGLRALGPIRFYEYRACEHAILTATFTRNKDGWYSGLCVAVPFEQPDPPALPAVTLTLRPEQHEVCLSDGRLFTTPAIGARYTERIARANQRLSARRGPDSRKPGQRVSKRWRRKQEQVEKLHMRAARARDLAQKTLARRITETVGVIEYEPIAVQKIVKRPQVRPDPEGPDGSFLPNGKARRSERNREILDFAPGEFIGRLKQAADWRGVAVVAKPAEQVSGAGAGSSGTRKKGRNPAGGNGESHRESATGRRQISAGAPVENPC